MSYEPTVWKTDDTVTAELLNKMEQGIASPIVTITRHIISYSGVTYRQYFTQSDIDSIGNANIINVELDDVNNYTGDSYNSRGLYFSHSVSQTRYYYSPTATTINGGLYFASDKFYFDGKTYTYDSTNDYWYNDVSGGGGN